MNSKVNQRLSLKEQLKLLSTDKWAYILTFVTFVHVLNFNLYADDPNFGERVDLGLIEYDPINEASGIAMSKKNTDVLWTHNDSGDQNRIYALNSQGKHLGVYYIDGVLARDWEDIALGPGPVDGEYYLYIGEIGDNDSQYDLKYIYRVLEPAVDSNQVPLDTTIFGAETITFQYPDGNRNAETLMVDPLTKDIYVVSKREGIARVYRAPYPQSTTDTVTVEHVATLNLTNTVGGDISPSGRELLIKTYSNIYYWCRTPEQNLWQAFDNEPVIVSYIPEPQGEAICWDSDGMGYYTTSEELFGFQAHLYFYPRLTTSVVNNEKIPPSFILEQNYPNPFNPETHIVFELPKQSNVSLKIYNIQGQLIKTLANGSYNAGFYKVTWRGKDTNGNPVSSGIYFYQLQTGTFYQVKKMSLLR